MFILRSIMLCSFLFLTIQNIQSIMKRRRFISYPKYVLCVRQAVREINTDMVAEVSSMYEDMEEPVDAQAMIANLRRLTGVFFVLHPFVAAFIYKQPHIMGLAFILSMCYLIGNFCLEQILVGSQKKAYLITDYIIDHTIPFLNLLIVIAMIPYL